MTTALLANLASDPVDASTPESRIGTERYLSPERLATERQRVFARLPVIVAHRSEVAEPGQCVVTDVAGRSILIARDTDGELRGFINACRHRGTRLATAPCRKKAFVCPYHGWTYGLDGSLLHIPHESAFETLPPERRTLAAVPVSERHGFVWVGGDVESHLGPLDHELSALAMHDHVLFETYECERDANWKLIIDLFLEGYHLRTLHRDTVYPYFVDSQGRLEPLGDHVVAVSARRTLPEASQSDLDRALRDYVTPNYLVFPNTIIIAHPDYISRLTVFPLSESRTRWIHSILIPTAPTTEREREHWRRSSDLIEGQVFQKEDLHIAEEMHRGLASGADRDILIGKLESGIAWFHASLDRYLAQD